MKKIFLKIVIGVVLVCILFVCFLYTNNEIGVTSSKLEADIRSSQKIKDDWTVDGSVSSTMAAYISYPQDLSDHSFSVYVNRPGLSFGYFFRGGGTLSGIQRGIVEFTVEGYNERAFISMNQQQVQQLEIDDGNTIQVVDIDRNKPFAIVLPINAGNITFYDVNRNTVEYWNILSFCELAAGGRNGLEPVEKTVIDRAVRIVYRPYIADPRPENMPLLEDLYDEIKRQPEPEAQRIAAALELYVHGSLNVFNHRTNVDINNRIVCFDIKELGKQLKSLGMLVIQDQVWNRVSQNRDQGKSTWYFVDEFHLLLRGEVGSWSVEIWKRFRKWGGIPTGITQNIKDLLSSPEIENIFENSDFVYLLNQASGDRKILCERLNISNQQAAHISNAGPGEGLIFFGNVILPFVDDFPKDNELYSIMTTKLGETGKGENGHE